MMVRTLIPILAALLLGLSTPGLAAEPTDTLRKHIDEFISVLQDPQYKDASKEEIKTEKTWEIIEKMFLFEGVARLALGKDWKKFNDAEKKDFTDSFTKLLGNSYLKKIKTEYTNEVVEYLDQELRGNDKGLVRTKIVRRAGDIPVDYSMLLFKGAWRVYDVKIEGASLVKNYRAQFNKILMNNPPAYLIERVKKKVEQQEKGQAAEDDTV